jgi:L-cysteine S-thiosulfotransferase
MRRAACGCLAIAAMITAAAFPASSRANEIAGAERRSGIEFMSRENQAMQRDDMANPGMLFVGEGDALWNQKAGAANRACAVCHGDAAQSMKGVAARYPAYDDASSRPVSLEQRINLCREKKQDATPFAWESKELLALTAYVAKQSRGIPVAPSEDTRLTPFRERGKMLFEQRMGQLNFSCANCHDDNWGKRLGGSVIPQAHPTGYPIYRLEWQGLGSLQRRLRNCMNGVRAEPYPYGAPEFIDLEVYMMSRAAGLPIETPAVRP